MTKPVGLYLKVDMDYCADPIWISENLGETWINDDLIQYQDKMSEELYKLFILYRDNWEDDLWSVTSDDLVSSIQRFNNIDAVSIIIAEQLQKEWPDCHIYAGFYVKDLLGHQPEYKVIKINENS